MVRMVRVEMESKAMNKFSRKEIIIIMGEKKKDKKKLSLKGLLFLKNYEYYNYIKKKLLKNSLISIIYSFFEYLL